LANSTEKGLHNHKNFSIDLTNMIDFLIDTSEKHPHGEILVKTEVTQFIGKYFPDIYTNKLKIIITEDVTGVVKKFCEKAEIPDTLVLEHAEGFAKELNGVVFLVYDYKLVGFPHLFPRNEYPGFWMRVKEYLLHHELQHIKNRRVFKDHLGSAENTKLNFIADRMLDEYLAIYFSLLNFGNNGCLPFYLHGTKAYETFKLLTTTRFKEILKTYGIFETKTKEKLLDDYILELTISFSKILAYYHANEKINLTPIRVDELGFLPKELLSIYLDFDKHFKEFNNLASDIFLRGFTLIIEKLFYIFEKDYS
jgi:hypothetical protein